MKEEQVKKLLQRYMEADTTPAEEELLRRYFNEGGYDAQIARYAPFFTALPNEENALTDEERDEILLSCVVSSSSASISWLRYAAVWLVGIIIGGSGVWLTHDVLLSEVQNKAQVNVLHMVDTLYRERIVTRSDTVYVVKYKTLVVPAPAVAATEDVSKEEKLPELPTMSFETMYDEAYNVVELAVR